MTKKDFFILLVKVFGLFSLITSLSSGLPNAVLFGAYDLDFLTVFWITFSVIVVIGLFLLLIFNSDKIVSLLKLDKGFDDNRIELGNINSVDIVKLGTFIIGGLLFLNNIPTFLGQTLYAFRGNSVGLVYEGDDQIMWAFSGINLIIGYILITNYDVVANKFVILKKKKE